MKIKFPQDFNKTAHRLPGAVQFNPKETMPVFISIMGGYENLYGNGTTSFELRIGEKVHGWLSAEDVTTHINKVLNLITH